MTEACVGSGTQFGARARVINIRRIRENIRVGNNCAINGDLVVFGHSGKIDIGDWCYIGEGARVWSSEHVMIGNRVLVAHNVDIHDTNSHPVDAVSRHMHFVAIKETGHPNVISDIGSRPVVIEDDVWIGFGSIILKGVHIGSGAIIGAGSIVTRDIPPNCIYAGGRIVKYADS